MANWIRKIDLTDLFQKCDENGYCGDDALTVADVAAETAKRLKRIRYTKRDCEDFERLNEQIEEIECWFEDVKEDGGDLVEYNGVLRELYDFGDRPLDKEWNGKKTLWIAT